MDVMADSSSAEPEPHRTAIPGVHQARGRRRPSGEPPPLPRALGRSGRFWIVVMAILAVFIVVLARAVLPLAAVGRPRRVADGDHVHVGRPGPPEGVGEAGELDAPRGARLRRALPRSVPPDRSALRPGARTRAPRGCLPPGDAER